VVTNALWYNLPATRHRVDLGHAGRVAGLSRNVRRGRVLDRVHHVGGVHVASALGEAARTRRRS